MKFWCHIGKHEFKEEPNKIKHYITNLLDEKKQGKTVFEFVCNKHFDRKARDKEICLEYFKRHPETKQNVFEKGSKNKSFEPWIPKEKVPMIQKIIKKEEEDFLDLVERSKKILSKYKVDKLTGEILCMLHHTHGIDPFMVEDYFNIDLPNELHDDYLAEYEKHKQTGREGFKPKEIKVENPEIKILDLDKDDSLDVIYQRFPKD